MLQPKDLETQKGTGKPVSTKRSCNEPKGHQIKVMFAHVHLLLKVMWDTDGDSINCVPREQCWVQ